MTNSVEVISQSYAHPASVYPIVRYPHQTGLGAPRNGQGMGELQAGEHRHAQVEERAGSIS